MFLSSVRTRRSSVWMTAIALLLLLVPEPVLEAGGRRGGGSRGGGGGGGGRSFSGGGSRSFSGGARSFRSSGRSSGFRSSARSARPSRSFRSTPSRSYGGRSSRSYSPSRSYVPRSSRSYSPSRSYSSRSSRSYSPSRSYTPDRQPYVPSRSFSPDRFPGTSGRSSFTPRPRSWDRISSSSFRSGASPSRSTVRLTPDRLGAPIRLDAFRGRSAVASIEPSLSTSGERGAAGGRSIATSSFRARRGAVGDLYRESFGARGTETVAERPDGAPRAGAERPARRAADGASPRRIDDGRRGLDAGGRGATLSRNDDLRDATRRTLAEPAPDGSRDDWRRFDKDHHDDFADFWDDHCDDFWNHHWDDWHFHLGAGLFHSFLFPFHCFPFYWHHSLFLHHSLHFSDFFWFHFWFGYYPIYHPVAYPAYVEYVPVMVPAYQQVAYQPVYVDPAAAPPPAAEPTLPYALTEQLQDLATDQEAVTWLEQGARRFRAGDYPAAADAFRRAMLLQQQNAVPKFALGHALFALGRYDEATFLIRRAMQILPDWPGTGPALHELYGTPEQLTEHLIALRAHLAARPDDADARFLLGYVSFFSGDLDGAETAFQAVLDGNPQSVEAAAFLARITEVRAQLETEDEDG